MEDTNNEKVIVLETDISVEKFDMPESYYGIFIEEINNAGEGGLYAELIRDRSFEDLPFIKGEVDDQVIDFYGYKRDGVWKKNCGENTHFAIDSIKENQLNEKQNNCMKIIVNNSHAELINEGFYGISVTRNTPYKFSIFARCVEFSGEVFVSLSKDCKILAKTNILVSSDWKKFEQTLIPDSTYDDVTLSISIQGSGTVFIDMVSLFPPTFMNRDNGMRIDIAEKIVALSPKFIRFPGGCFVEANGLKNAWDWKKTIGPIEERTGHINTRWRYFCENGLGLDEYMQFCEDIGAHAMLNVNAGIAHAAPDGYRNTLPEEFEYAKDINPYISDALDAIEYLTGDDKTLWGSKRIQNGRVKPYKLKYIEIGNENSGEYYDKVYEMFYEAIKSKYPDLIIIRNATDPKVYYFDTTSKDIHDAHFYYNPDWFVNNAEFFDNYDRAGAPVYIGEYQAFADGKHKVGSGNLYSGVSEAAFLIGCENNCDVVKMVTAAPLLCNANQQWHWNPDLLYFNSSKIYATPTYYVNKMLASSIGTTLLKVNESNNALIAEQMNNLEFSTPSRKIHYSITKDTASKTVFIKLVNATDNVHDICVKIDGISKIKSLTKTHLSHNDILAENSFENPENIVPVTDEFDYTDTSINDTLSPYSFVVYSLNY